MSVTSATSSAAPLPGSEREAHIRGGKRGRIVHPVARHANLPAVLAQRLDLCGLFVRQNAGLPARDAYLLGERAHRFRVVA